MKNVIITFCFLSILFTSCSHAPRYGQLADTEVNAFAREMLQEHSLTMICYGGGYIDRINNISLAFTSKKNLSIPEARLLFLDVSESFLQRLNKHSELPLYFAHNPFCIDDFSLAITFPPISDSSQANLVTLVGMDNVGAPCPGQILYLSNDIDNGQINLLLQETYEEALERAYRLIPD